MPQFDYRISVLTHGRMGISKGEINREVLERELDEAGKDGWELIHVWFDQKLHKEKDGHVLVFKKTLG